MNILLIYISEDEVKCQNEINLEIHVHLTDVCFPYFYLRRWSDINREINVLINPGGRLCNFFKFQISMKHFTFRLNIPQSDSTFPISVDMGLLGIFAVVDPLIWTKLYCFCYKKKLLYISFFQI